MSDFEMYVGDTKRVQIDVVDQVGAPVDLTSAALTWVLASWSGGAAILTKTKGAGIAVSVPPSGSTSSRMTVTIGSGEVAVPAGDYYHAARVEISGVRDTVRAGTVRVLATPAP